MRELQAVTVKLSRGGFTLRADNAALATLEDEYDKPFDEVVSDLLGKMRIKQVCRVAAIFARATTPDVTAESVLNAAPTIEDLAALREGIQDALIAALPPKKDAPAGDVPAAPVDSRPLGNG